MTKTIAIKNGRLFRDTSGNLAFSTGIDACMQNCQTAMLTVQGEMMYNVAGGMPYQVTVWDNYRPKLFEAAARIVLSNVKDVLSIESFLQKVIDGVLEYTATIRTIYGVVIVEKTNDYTINDTGSSTAPVLDISSDWDGSVDWDGEADWPTS